MHESLVKMKVQANDIIETTKPESPAAFSATKDGVLSLTVEVVEDVKQFAQLRDEWDEVGRQAPCTVYQTFDWLYQWWEHLGACRDRTLHILLFRHQGLLVGIVPFFLEVHRMFGMPLHKILRPMGCGVFRSGSPRLFFRYSPSDYLDAIVVPAFAQHVAKSLCDYWQAGEVLFDELELSDVPDDSVLLRELVQELDKNKIRWRISKAEVCPRLGVPSSMEAFFKELPSSVRRRLSQAYRAARAGGMFAIRSIDALEELPHALEQLKTLHQGRWNSLGYLGVFTDRQFERFQLEVARAFFARGYLWFKTAETDGHVVAARLGFRFKGTFYDYLTGFDDRSPAANRRPGLALLLLMIEDAIREGARTVDLLRGTERYKLELTSTSTHTWNISVRRTISLRVGISRLLWKLLSFWKRFVKEWLIVQVHYRQHGTHAFVPHYVKFRFKRLMNRDPRPVKHTPPKTQQADEKPALLEFVTRIFAQSDYPILRKIAAGLRRDRGLPLSKKIRKGLVFLRALLLARIYLFGCNAVGKGSRTRGRPLIDNLGRIIIGSGFNLNSRIVRSELATGPRGTIEIGDDVSINFGASISAQAKVKIGSRVRIGPYAMIIDSDFHTPGGDPYGKASAKPIFIEDDVWLGGRVTVLKGTTIGARSVITAGSVVSGAIPPDVIAGGVPARVLRRLQPLSEEQADVGRQETIVDNQITQRVKGVFTKTFRLANSVNLSWGPSQIAQWDSLGHLNLIVALESEFGVTLTEDDMLHITTVRHACEVIDRHLRGNQHRS